MCYTGLCFWENFNGECSNINKSHCPEEMEIPCNCGCDLKQLQDDGKYHCIDCDKILE